MGARGTTNGNVRGSTYDRRQRRAWLMVTYASDVPGFVRCYRCGTLLYNEDAPPNEGWDETAWIMAGYATLTIDRVIPGILGGTYRRNNIRPACGSCNSETGANLGNQRKRS